MALLFDCCLLVVGLLWALMVVFVCCWLCVRCSLCVVVCWRDVVLLSIGIVCGWLFVCVSRLVFFKKKWCLFVGCCLWSLYVGFVCCCFVFFVLCGCVSLS